MATHLVTGAAGFIGSRVCELLLAGGGTVVGIDNLNDYYDVRLKDWRLGRLLEESGPPPGTDPGVSAYASRRGPLSGRSGRFRFYRCDIEDLSALEALFGEFEFDAVFNLAARAGVRHSLVDPHVYLTTNAHGTLNLLECQRKHGVKKHVLASTSSLYAGCPMPFTEDQPVNRPFSPYAASKKAAELLAHSYHHLHGLDVSVLRYFTAVGPAGRPDMAPFRFVKWIDEGTPITLYGDGTQARDFAYVDDIARGTVLAAKPVGFEIVNLGGGQRPVSLQTAIGWIEHRLGKRARIEGQPFQEVDMKETWADIAKAGRLFGWAPAIAPEEGFRRTVEWHVANRAWLAGIKV